MLQAYKHVSALLVRSLKRSPPVRRINTFYVLSAICRQSKMQLKAADKYGAASKSDTRLPAPGSRALHVGRCACEAHNRGAVLRSASATPPDAGDCRDAR